MNNIRAGHILDRLKYDFGQCIGQKDERLQYKRAMARCSYLAALRH